MIPILLKYYFHEILEEVRSNLHFSTFKLTNKLFQKITLKRFFFVEMFEFKKSKCGE